LKKVRIITIVGARPQFIKAAVISRAIRESFSGELEETLVHTGQHFDEDMSGVFFEKLGISAPAFHLDMGQSGSNANAMVKPLSEIIQRIKPEAVLLYGDTNSTLAGAIAAKVSGSKPIHVEAGLRSGNWEMPEEENRVVTDHLSDMLFCPTPSAMDLLAREGLVDGANKVLFSGDVMLDSARHHASLVSFDPLRQTLGIQKPYCLLTLHRGANVDNPDVLLEILATLNDLTASQGLNVILPLHPRTKQTLAKIDFSLPKNIQVISPQDYEAMLCLEQNAELILTDSGGVQKEAYFFGRPCGILRSETEWTELVAKGGHVLLGNTAFSIRNGFDRLGPGISVEQNDLFGSGHAGHFICREIIKRYRTC